MTEIRKSSFEEYVEWYVQREHRKGNILCDPHSFEEQVEIVQKAGKVHNWFPNGDWKIVRIERDEFECLVPAYQSWTQKGGILNPKGRKNDGTLRKLAEIAIKKKHLYSSEGAAHRKYYDQLKIGKIRLEGKDRIVLCSLGPDEECRDPSGSYHLQDGWGRALSYQVLIIERRLTFEPIEAFLAIYPKK